jgi:ABC-type amino acid transport substrate-binding protein
MKRWLGLAAALSATLACPSAAQVAADQVAERRVRTCLTTAAPGAPRESLAAAVTALRALCRPQIVQLSRLRLQGLREGEARNRAVRLLNDEITHAVAGLTGLHQ